MGAVKSAGLISHASLPSVAEEVRKKGGGGLKKHGLKISCLCLPASLHELRLQNLHLLPVWDNKPRFQL